MNPDSIPFGAPPIVQNQDSIPFGSPPIAAAKSGGLPSLSEVGHGAAKLLRDVETPFVSVAATPVQLLAKALGQKDPYANNAMPSIGGEGIPVAPITPKGFLQKAGQAGEIAALVASGGVSGVAANAGLGIASGLSQSLAEGNTERSQLLKDSIYGGLFGFGLGAVGKFLNYVGKNEVARTGVEGVVRDAIDHTEPDLLAKYINASKNHAETMSSLSQPTAVGLAENEFDRRAAMLTGKVIPQAGEAVGAAKRAAADLPIIHIDESGAESVGIDALHQIGDKINNAMQQMTGHEFMSYANPEEMIKINLKGGASTQGIGMGSEDLISQIPGRSVDLSSKETKQLENLAAQLKKLQENPNVQTASDVLINLDNDIGKWGNKQFGEGNSPVEGVLKFARGTINRAIAPASPEIAKANATYSSLMDLKQEIARQAGAEGQSSALAMRRVLSGDKSNSVVPMLNQLDAVTAPFRKGDVSSLIQHSILSNWSTTMFGDATTKGLLSKAMAEGRDLSNEGASVFGYPRQWMRSLIQSSLSAISPNPEGYAMAMANGKEFSLNPLVRFLDKAMDSTAVVPIFGDFMKQLKEWGVSATNAEPAAKILTKIFLMQQLTRTNSFTPPNGVPQTLSPSNTINYPQEQQSTTSQPVSLGTTKQTASAIRELTPAQSGQAMGRTLGVPTPGKLNMTNSLT